MRERAKVAHEREPHMKERAKHEVESFLRMRES